MIETSVIAQGVRRVRMHPFQAAIASLTLALGIGAATAIFTIVNGVLLRPLPYAQPGELVTVWQTDTRYREQATLERRWDRLWFTYPEYQAWRDGQTQFAGVAAYGSQQKALTGVGDPADVTIYAATPSLMPLLGVRPAIGRWFMPGEEGTGTERLAVLSHDIWMSRFGGDSTVIDRYVTLDDERYRVVGVAPAFFSLRELTGTEPAAQIWIPLGSDGGGQRFDSSYEGIGRLRTGASLQGAALETDRLVKAAAGRAERGARLVPRLEAETASARAPLALLSAGAALLLLTACANVANLLLGEAPGRAHELATRFALGASARRIVAQLLGEAFVVAAIGTVAGIGIALLGVRGLLLLAPRGFPRLESVENVAIDGGVLLFAVGATFVTALLSGAAPALSAVKHDLAHVLRSGGRHSRRGLLQRGVIAVQVAVAMLLLVGATLLTRSLQQLNAVEPGFRPGGVLSMMITAPEARYASREAIGEFYAQLEERLAALPGVRSVGATSRLPFTDQNATMNVEVEGTVRPAGTQPTSVQRRSVRSGYFETMGIPLRIGRTFAQGATPAAEIVIDEAAARRFWPNESALAKRLRVYGAPATVVGVVGSVRHGGLADEAQPTVYLPHAAQATRGMAVVLRVDSEGPPLLDAIRNATWSLDPTIPIPEIVSMETRIRRSMSGERYRTTLVTTFGVAALLLVAIGVLGVAVRAIALRRRELGIRVALGAQQGSITRLVVGSQGASIGVGMVAGVVLALGVSPLLSRFLFGIAATDPVSIVVAGAIVGAVTLAATWLPARRAARVDPGIALRVEG